jgi:hypothetical protein
LASGPNDRHPGPGLYLFGSRLTFRGNLDQRFGRCRAGGSVGNLPARSRLLSQFIGRPAFEARHSILQDFHVDFRRSKAPASPVPTT